MSSSIGSTTAVSSVADDVRQYKERHLHAPAGNATLLGGGRRRGAEPDKLSLLCLRVMAKHFAARPILHALPERQVPVLTALLDLDLDIEIAAATVYDENFWRRKALGERWKSFEIAEHGLTWKQLYFERKLEQLLEEFRPDGAGAAREASDVESKHAALLEELEAESGPGVAPAAARGAAKLAAPATEAAILAHLRAGKDYVFQLNVKQLPSHIDLLVLFQHLPNLARLELSYGVRGIGMRYERSLFGIKMSDSASLARSIQQTSVLTTLALPSNLIDDDLLRMLMSGLVSNCTITALDLSHNKITNHGARLLAKLLGPKSVLASLNLSDNALHAEAGRYLGRALRRNNSLLELNLRLNRLTDDGGAMLLEGLQGNASLTLLNLSCNSLGPHSGDALAALFDQGGSAISALDLSCNELADPQLQALSKALGGAKQGCPLLSLDVRKNLAQESVVDHLMAIVKRAEMLARRTDDL
jgi:hypothetical protein